MKSLSQSLSKWYLANQRELPWRRNKNPYFIWLSEVMLQQTTVQAVVPYFEMFILRFPNIQSLASAPLDEVLSAWAGLGYYSRAINLHRAAVILSQQPFPRRAEELIQLPGFGPYTSRAVASLAFGEKVGVLDGNVIRILCRLHGFQIPWWTSPSKQLLQDISDQLVQHGDPAVVNQAMMELGATICTPHNPLCIQCPWQKICVSRKQDLIGKIPLKKPRRAQEVWVWKPVVAIKGNRVAVIKNNYAPFLKDQWIFPGSIKKHAARPKSFDLQHGITHHSIFIKVNLAKKLQHETRGIKWVTTSELKKLNPSSLLQKVLVFHDG